MEQLDSFGSAAEAHRQAARRRPDAGSAGGAGGNSSGAGHFVAALRTLPSSAALAETIVAASAAENRTLLGLQTVHIFFEKVRRTAGGTNGNFFKHAFTDLCG